MAREWTVEKIINGKKYKIFYSEYDYLGGSTHIISRMECVDAKYVQETNKNIKSIKGGNIGK